MVKLSTGTLFVVGALAMARAAYADPVVYETEETPSDYSYGWNEPRMATGVGVGITIGGGIAGFTDQSLRNSLSTSVNGLWDARVSIGTHVPIGLDVSYIGMAGNLNTLQGASNGTLVGTTAEAALRWNILPHFMWDPYVFAGVGYQRWDVTSMKFATADTGVKNSENLAEYPMGAGLSFRHPSGWLADVRGTFRAEPSSTLVRDVPNGAFASAHWWEASAAVGYEF